MSQVSLTGTVYLKLVNARRLSTNVIGVSRSETMIRDESVVVLDDVYDEEEDSVDDKSSFQVSVSLAELESDASPAPSMHFIGFLPLVWMAAEGSCLNREHKMKRESRPEGLCIELSGLHCYGSDAASKDFS
eukprot:scaffold19148_cov73-Cyclotella_meneghiniana.AAC.1